MKKLISILLALSMIFCFAGCKDTSSTSKEPSSSSESSTTGKMKLKKVGSIKKDNLSNATFYYQGIVNQTSDGKYEVLNHLGENVSKKTFDYCETLNFGLFTTCENNDSINNVGLISSEDGVLIPCEAASIKEINDKYLIVIYATEKVDNEDDAMVYSTDKDVSVMPTEGDELYAGYGKIYNTETKSFVEGIKIEDNSMEVNVIGDNLLIGQEYTNKNQALYAPDGTEIAKFESNYICGNYIAGKDGDTYKVYDSNHTEICEVNFKPELVVNENLFITYNSEDTENHYILVDKTGSKVSEYSFSRSPKSTDNYIYGETENTDGEEFYGILNTKGEIVKEFKYSYIDYYKNFAAFVDEFFTLEENGNKINWIPSNDSTFEGDDIISINGDKLINNIDGKTLLSEYKGYSFSNKYVYAETDEAFDIYEIK